MKTTIVMILLVVVWSAPGMISSGAKCVTWLIVVIMQRRLWRMENIINYICNGSNEFTPAVVVGLIVFCMVLESISSIAANCLKVGRWSYAWIVIIYHCFCLHHVGLRPCHCDASDQYRAVWCNWSVSVFPVPSVGWMCYRYDLLLCWIVWQG